MPFGFGGGLIGTDQIADGAVTNAKVNATAAILQTKIETAMVHGASKHDTTVESHGVGTYAGNASQNRAVAHGLGRTPKTVLVIGNNNPVYGNIALIRESGSTKGRAIHDTADLSFVPTDMDATNFYIGTASGVGGNEAATTFYFVAV
jgi:hypothetical protein